jgi:hypothetical protein
MTIKQERYTFNTYDPVSLQIKSYSKVIKHFGILGPFVVNINDNVDMMTKSAIDEVIFFFEKQGYFSPLQCCLLAVIVHHYPEVTLEELAMDKQLFGYLAFGTYRNKKVNTATVLHYLTSKKGFQYHRIYRVNDHSIIHPSELSFFRKKYEKHPDDSRRLFYLCRCMHFNQLTKRGKTGTGIPLSSSYFQLFLSLLLKAEDTGYEVDDQMMKTIGAIEFEVRDLAELDRISQLLKDTLVSEELGLTGENGLNHPFGTSNDHPKIPF